MVESCGFESHSATSEIQALRYCRRGLPVHIIEIRNPSTNGNTNPIVRVVGLSMRLTSILRIYSTKDLRLTMCQARIGVKFYFLEIESKERHKGAPLDSLCRLKAIGYDN